MKSDEPALRALRTLVQFELAETANKVAQAAQLRAHTQQELDNSQRRCESASSGLRAVMERAQMNPALLDAMRRLYRVEQREFQQWQVQLSTAQDRERQVRSELADVRNQERALDRALQNERGKRRARQQALEISQADDLWLQRAWMELS